MQMQSTYWLEKVLKMISLYVNALLCTLQHIVINPMQLSGVNSPNLSPNIFLQVFQCLWIICIHFYPQISPTDKRRKWTDPAIAAATNL